MQQQHYDDGMANQREIHPDLSQPSYPIMGFEGSAEGG